MGETEFLKVFGRITVSDILIWILAIGYLVPKIRQFYGWSRKYWQKAEKREQAINSAGKFDDFRHKADDAHEELQRQYPVINITVSGGVSSLEDILRLDAMGLRSVIVGKALYEGRITLKQIEQCLQNA